jgi:F-type H+-transporting ATPase subunit b
MALFLMVSEAYASGGGGDPPDLNAIAFHAINAFLLIALLTYLLREKIRDALANRAAGVKREIDESNQARKDAAQQLEELESRLDGFETELEKMKTDAVDNAAKEHEAILARAEEDAARIAESAERSIRDETERARQALRQEVAELAVELARERLLAEVNTDDQNRLAGDFIDTVQNKNGASNG